MHNKITKLFFTAAFAASLLSGSLAFFFPASAAGAAHPDAAVSFTIDMNQAIAYADQWALSRNPLYEDFTGEGGNCANFVSQCMVAAGFPLNGEWYMKYVKYDRGPWFYASENYLYFSNYGTAEAANENNIKRGDLVYYDWTGDGHIDHTAICVGKDGDGAPVVDSNTQNAYHGAWKLGANNANAKFYVIHLNKCGIAYKPVSMIFDKDYYYAHNPDLQVALGNDETALLRHFLTYGTIEGRQGNAAFDPKAYAAAHPHVSDKYGSKGYRKYYYDYMAKTGDPAGAMYRMYNPVDGEHFYTASANERAVLCGRGWNFEGIGWLAPTGGAPVFRFFNHVEGGHLFTTDTHERDVLLTNHDWNYEGIAWYSDGAQGLPVYRQFSPVTGAHNYTADLVEKNYLTTHGWNDEGIAWYGKAN